VWYNFSKMLLTAYQNTRRYNQDNDNKLINISSIALFFLFTPPMKMEQCFETSALKILTLENHPKERIQHSQHRESWKSRIANIVCLFVCLFCLLLMTLLFKRVTFYSSAKHAAVHKTMHTVSFPNATTFGSNNSYQLQTVSLI